MSDFAPNPAALDFLLSRQSRPARSLTRPVPSHAELTQILTAAARVPDHGKLTPWRFIVLRRAALDRLAELVPVRGEALGIEPERIAKSVAQYRDADLAVAVISSLRETERIPEVEQILSAGAVCMTLLSAAIAQGWGANWLTGWPVYDAIFRAEGLDLAEAERVAGIIHIGTATGFATPRPRPDLDRITTWAEG